MYTKPWGPYNRCITFSNGYPSTSMVKFSCHLRSRWAPARKCKKLCVSVAVCICSCVSVAVYLGQLFSLDEDLTTEIKRRISSAWSKFGRLSRYLQDVKFPLTLKRKIFNQCVMPVLLYGAETRTTTKKMAPRLNCAHRAMERK